MSPSDERLNAGLADYYAARAPEYEAVYAKPERQADLRELRRLVTGYFAGRHVLEVACGTGYWTVPIASSAASVHATDVGAEVLDIARAKSLPPGVRVEFGYADAYALDAVPGNFDAAFAGFWLSHVRREDAPRFLRGLNDRVGPGARVMLVDNRYVEGSSLPITRTDTAGDTYQHRTLGSGAEYEVLKNFPTAGELRDWAVECGGDSVEVVELSHYWCLTYEVAATR